jgi:hypothetical protein
MAIGKGTALTIRRERTTLARVSLAWVALGLVALVPLSAPSPATAGPVRGPHPDGPRDESPHPDPNYPSALRTCPRRERPDRRQGRPRRTRPRLQTSARRQTQGSGASKAELKKALSKVSRKCKTVLPPDDPLGQLVPAGLRGAGQNGGKGTKRLRHGREPVRPERLLSEATPAVQVDPQLTHAVPHGSYGVGRSPDHGKNVFFSTHSKFSTLA